MDPYKLVERAKREIADGSPSALKTAERARRELYRRGDVEGLERLCELVGRLPGGGKVEYAIRQNLAYLARRRSRGSSGPAPFVFGDARRTRSLAIAWMAAIAAFPVAWFGLLLLYGLGGSNATSRTLAEADRSLQHDERVIVVVAAIVSAVLLVGLTIGWIRARRRHPPETRSPLVAPEIFAWATAVLLVLAAAYAFGAYLWRTPI